LTAPDQGGAGAFPTKRRITRNMVTRADGKLVNVARMRGHLFVCAMGCCCGDTVHGAAAVPTDLYQTEWEGRKLRPHVHLSMGGCLGPCTLANVVMLLIDGRPIWFHSFNSERLVLALYDYIESMVEAQAYLPPPPPLSDLQFNTFRWDGATGHAAAAPLSTGEGQSLPATGSAAQHPPLPLGEGWGEGVASSLGGGFVFLTHADTDLLALSKVRANLGPDFPPVRGFNISHLKSEADAASFVDAVARSADVVILRLLGGRSSFRGGFERAVERATADDQWLLCLPGTDALDPDLTAASNVGAEIVHESLAYLRLGGLENFEHLLRFLSDHLLTTGFGYDAPRPQPRHGIYYRSEEIADPDAAPISSDAGPISSLSLSGGEGWGEGVVAPTLGVLFYRSHLLSGNTEFVDAIVREIERRDARALAVYTSSLQDMADGPSLASPSSTDDQGPVLPAALQFFAPDGRVAVDAVITTTSFAAASGNVDATHDPFVLLGVPVIQAVAASMGREQWEESLRGLSPVDTAMNVAIPELDGRINAPPVSFKRELSSFETNDLGVAPQLYEPNPHGVARAVGLALRHAALRHKPNRDKRIAVVLSNANAKASRVGAAVGLDTPASVVRILRAMSEAGYEVGEIPASGDMLLHALIERGSYDRDVVTSAQLAMMLTHVSPDTAKQWVAELPEGRRAEMAGRWGEPPGERYVDASGNLALAGLTFGNVFVAIQPPRGYAMDPAAIYHSPELPPPYPFHALYRWLAEPVENGGWGADAMVHVGKHGTLEWLPGKSVGLSESCFPDLFLGDMPLIYPFIINNPGEGAQAKRRAHAVIVDHLTPPMTTAEGYGEVEELSRLVDEYYQLEQLDPSKLPLLQQQIWELIKQARLDADLGQLLNRDSAAHTHPWDPQAHEDGVPYSISDMGARDFAHLIENVNGYLCELTSAQIRDGLHTLGEAPRDTQLIDTLLSLVRLPNLAVPSLREGVADWFGLDLAAILDRLEVRVSEPGQTAGQPTVLRSPSGSLNGRENVESVLLPTAQVTREGLEGIVGRMLPTNADVLEAIDLVGRRLLGSLAGQDYGATDLSRAIARVLGAEEGRRAARPHPNPLAEGEGRGPARIEVTLRFVCDVLVPNLRRTDEEILNLLRALDGRHVAAGPSGAPTRGMAQVLPTGRNFFTVDPRGLPTLAAWTVGQQLADALIERHVADEGRYPETVGISIWGTSLMRTHGDDVAEVMALIGVRPRWQPESRRLIGFDIIPLDELGRPRVDVVCRISGFFRDAFPELIALLDDAFRTVAAIDEPLDLNVVRRHALAQTQQLETEGVRHQEAERRSMYRVFGSPPGAYGAGILPLIDARNWKTDADLAEVYVNWGGYAYTAEAFGIDAREDFRSSLARVDAAVKNQDNREHDIFDSDDYFQYHGGMIAAIRSLAGRNPRRYFGDSADPQRARVRDLKEEALRVFRSRVVNPKWIASMRRHGYKGALEMAATVDYLFGYDATSDVVDDWMYERVAQAYALEPEVQAFFIESNPWALRDLTSRLMEAMDRGLWHDPTPEMREALQAAYLLAESDVESHANAAQARGSQKGALW